MSSFFPLETVVLSSNALCEYLKQKYLGFADVTCRLYYRSLHDTYHVTVQGIEYYFKIYRQGLRSKEEIISEVDLINILHNHKIETAYPIANKDGNYVSEFEIPGATRYGVLFTTVGNDLFNARTETQEFNKALGESIGNVHQVWDNAMLSHCRRPLDARLFIDESMRHIRYFAKLYYFDIDFLESLSVKVADKINKLSKDNPCYGICHGDIYADNIRMNKDGKPILFDFDFAGDGWRAYDISLYAYSFSLGAETSEHDKRKRRFESFLEGYSVYRILSESEIKSIPLFIPFRRIFNIGSLYIAMSNVWGDLAALRSTRNDIELLKKWIDLNPVL